MPLLDEDINVIYNKINRMHFKAENVYFFEIINHSLKRRFFTMDEDLYGDIESSGKDEEIRQLQEQLACEKQKNVEFTSEITQLKQQITILVEERAQLETNMMALYNTAKREIQRKDQSIAEAREQLVNFTCSRMKQDRAKTTETREA